jgi:murein DD-endopeptidase MepM/ murein hydrolase activator NlpD
LERLGYSDLMKAKTVTLMAGLTLLAAGALLLGAFSHKGRGRPGAAKIAKREVLAPDAAPADRVDTIDIPPQATFGELMTGAGVSAGDAAAIYAASKDVYDLATIHAGKKIDLHHDLASGALTELVYALNGDQELHVRKAGEAWAATKETIKYEVKLKSAKGTIASSLYAAGMDQGLDEGAIVALADVFQWTVDFSQDVRVGDTFSFTYEERYRDGKYVMPGDILAAEYVNAGVAHRAYHYTDASGEGGYYDENGNSLRKMFLKAPVAFKYITSGYTTGRRYVSAFNVSTGHRAIDYAAKIGTPIRATADGVVAFAGWDGPYGNKISIRHNSTYSTNYCHQSKFAVKKGQHVVQGQIIGYVGTTGFSTGPHLHYEMVKNGVKINPLKEVFPGTDPIKEGDKIAFQQVVDEWKNKL